MQNSARWCLSFRHCKRDLVSLKVCCLDVFSVSKDLTHCFLCFPIWWQAYPCSSDKECEVGRYCHSPHQGSSACMVCRRKKKRCHRDGMCCPGTRCNNGKRTHQGLNSLFFLISFCVKVILMLLYPHYWVIRFLGLGGFGSLCSMRYQSHLPNFGFLRSGHFLLWNWRVVWKIAKCSVCWIYEYQDK